MVLVILLDILRFIVGRLSVVHGVEAKSRVFDLDGLEECLEGLLETVFGQRLATQGMWQVVHTILDRFFTVMSLFRSSHPFQHHLWVVVCSRRMERTAWVEQTLMLARLDGVIFKLSDEVTRKLS